MSTHSSWRSDIKERLNLVEVAAETHQVKVRGSEGLALCPFHDDQKTPNLRLYADHYYCFACEATGDIFDWLEQVQGLSPDDAIAEARRRAGLDVGNPAGIAARHTATGGAQNGAGTTGKRGAGEVSAVAKPAPQLDWLPAFIAAAAAAYQRGESASAQEAQAAIDRRGLADVAGALRIGVADETTLDSMPEQKRAELRGRLIIPTFLDGRAVWFKARYVGSVPDEQIKERGIPKYTGPAGSIPAPYHADALELARRQRVLLLTEGELDAAAVLAALDLDMPVVGLPGGNLPQGWDARIAETRALIVVVMDADEAGARHAEKVRTELQALGAHVHVALPPDGHNDLNAALLALGRDGLAEKLLGVIAVAHEARAEQARALHSNRVYLTTTHLDEIRARRERPHTVYTTGIEALDRQLGGGFREGLHVVGGLTGTGKTSLALAIALHNARERRPVIYATYEQSRFELWARLVAAATGIPQRAQKSGVYEVDGWRQEETEEMVPRQPGWLDLVEASDYLNIVEAGDALSGLHTAWSLTTLADAAREISHAEGAPPLIVVDYLQRVPLTDDKRDVRERVSRVAGLLQVLSRSVGCPILALSSLNRASYRLAEADQEAKLAAFKEAGELEYTSHSASVVYWLPDEQRHRFGVPPAARYRAMAIDVIKNRDGECGQIAAWWLPERDTWMDV